MDEKKVFREVFKVYCNEHYGVSILTPAFDISDVVDMGLVSRIDKRPGIVLTAAGRYLIEQLSSVELVFAADSIGFSAQAKRLMKSCTLAELPEFLSSEVTSLRKRARKYMKELLQLEDSHWYWLAFLYAYNEVDPTGKGTYYEQLPLSSTLKRLHSLDFIHTTLKHKYHERMWVDIVVTDIGKGILAGKDVAEIVDISVRSSDDLTAGLYVQLLPLERLPEFLAHDRPYVAAAAKRVLEVGS